MMIDVDPALLTLEDIDTIIEGIDHFIIGTDDDADLIAIWQPYMDKLKALRAAMVQAGR